MNTEPTEKPLFLIDYDGRWFHDGGLIRRHELARLFALRGLRREADGSYWLQSPESRYPVTVVDVPFVVVDYEIKNTGSEQVIVVRTGMDECVSMDSENPLELRAEPLGGAIVPYIHIRNGLYARINRAVYYKLIALASLEHGRMMIRSGGVNHILGTIS